MIVTRPVTSDARMQRACWRRSSLIIFSNLQDFVIDAVLANPDQPIWHGILVFVLIPLICWQHQFQQALKRLCTQAALALLQLCNPLCSALQVDGGTLFGSAQAPGANAQLAKLPVDAVAAFITVSRAAILALDSTVDAKLITEPLFAVTTATPRASLACEKALALTARAPSARQKSIVRSISAVSAYVLAEHVAC